MTRFRQAGPALLLATLLLAGGCLRRESAVQSGNRDGILHRGMGYEVGSLDPQLAANIGEMDVASALFEGLVDEDPADLHPVPGVAARWEISPDRLTYTFYLRPEAKWSDGSPVTAADFVGSWRRILTPSLGAGNASLLFLLEGAEAYHRGLAADFSQVGATALDAHTLRVRLEHPAPYFLNLLAHPAWMPVSLRAITAAGAAADRGNPWARPGSLVGDGPFALKTWEPNRRIVVEKSPAYWDAARVRLQAIDFYPIESRDTEERSFRAGQLHITYALPFGKADSYRRSHPELLREDPYLDTYFFRLNVRRAPFGDARVRRALAQGIDRAAIVSRILRGGQRAATALTPPGLPGYTPPAGFAVDVAAARQLLADAGYPGGRGLPPIELLYNNSENLRLVAEAVQEMWRRDLGVDVHLASQEFKVVLSERRAGNYQMVLSDWVGDYPDPATFLEVWRGDSGSNQTGWSSAAYDGLLFAAARTADPAERAGLLRKAETLLLEAAPVIPLYYNTHVFLLQPSVRGWLPNLLDHHPYKQVWLED